MAWLIEGLLAIFIVNAYDKAKEDRKRPGYWEERRANNRMFWKFLRWPILAVVVLSLIGQAFSQTRTYQDNMGRNTGRSTTSGNTTTFYDAMGRNQGRAVTDSNGTITTYDNMGRQTGRSTK